MDEWEFYEDNQALLTKELIQKLKALNQFLKMKKLETHHTLLMD